MSDTVVFDIKASRVAKAGLGISYADKGKEKSLGLRDAMGAGTLTRSWFQFADFIEKANKR
jgi:hypothetical protein